MGQGGPFGQFPFGNRQFAPEPYPAPYGYTQGGFSPFPQYFNPYIPMGPQANNNQDNSTKNTNNNPTVINIFLNKNSSNKSYV